MTVKSENQLVS